MEYSYKPQNIKDFLELKSSEFNNIRFIDDDPIKVPHSFTNPKDIEIAAFLTSALAWGQRKTIIRNATRLMELMDHSPYDFISGAGDQDMALFDHFYHRTFQPVDCIYFLSALKNIYNLHGGLRSVFENSYVQYGDLYQSIVTFRKIFLELPHLKRTEKHIPDIEKNAACKRINMFLMWMVRKDSQQVHFGHWDKIPASALYIPLDVHVANVSRKLGLLTRKQNDWKSVLELTNKLRSFDPADPVRYDFALFGTGNSSQI